LGRAYGVVAVGAHASPPLVSCAHSEPAQQLSDPRAQGSPGATQTGSIGAPDAGTQTVSPADPMQEPPQQSSDAAQAAPVGAQASAQAEPPEPSGRQRPPQHCSGTEHGKPAAEQPAVTGRQRIRPAASARQLAPPQQSPSIMHSSPTT
jgi:hypothetical protein